MQETVTNLKWAIAFFKLTRLSECGEKGRALDRFLTRLRIPDFRALE